MRKRADTKRIKVGNVEIGGKNNVIIQSLSQNTNKIEDSVQKEPQKELNYHF